MEVGVGGADGADVGVWGGGMRDVSLLVGGCCGRGRGREARTVFEGALLGLRGGWRGEPLCVVVWVVAVPDAGQEECCAEEEEEDGGNGDGGSVGAPRRVMGVVGGVGEGVGWCAAAAGGHRNWG